MPSQTSQQPIRPVDPLDASGRIALLSLLVILFFGGLGLSIWYAVRLATPRPNTAPVASATPAPKPYADYAGSESCKSCHAEAYEQWRTSHHGLAERAPDPALDKDAFDPPRTFTHATQQTTVASAGGAYTVTAIGLEGQAAFPVARVIGVNPLRQYLTPAPGGRLQTLEASYDPRNNQWFNVYGSEDRKPGEWGHWTGRGMNWNSMCATCHNTRVFKNYDPKTDSYNTTYAQLTVSCESCHGPMKAHVDWQNQYKTPTTVSSHESRATSSPTRPADPTITKFTKDQTLHTCATCHSRRGELTGDFVPGHKYEDHFSLVIPDLSDLFYPDGQVREEDYEYTAFHGSKMHAAGVRCGDCHQPHSAKTLYPGNALCMRCHNGSFQGSPLIVPEAHSFHKSDSTGNQCINCHMPQTTYMQRHARHDHGFTVPDPLLTKEHNIPNACNRCHTDKDIDWSIASVDKWYGAKMNRPSRDRARAVAKARTGDESSRPALLTMLSEEKQPFWRSVAAAALSQWVDRPEVLAPLIAATSHEDPLLRENAARALEPMAQANEPTSRAALTKLLNDPARSVRVRAGWALRDVVAPESTAGKDLFAFLNTNADQPGGQMQLGIYQLARNSLPAAQTHFETAIKWDPNSAPFHDSLAVVLSQQGKIKEAIDSLKKAAAIDPREAEYPFKLGLAYNETGDLQQTIASLQQALKLNPRHLRAAYNLALAYSQTNQSDRAIALLRNIEQLEPNNPQYPWARATMHAQLGQKEEAREAAIKVLQINPQSREARQLLQSLGR